MTRDEEAGAMEGNSIGVQMGAALKAALDHDGLTQAEFARWVSVSEKHMSQVINGQSGSLPTLDQRASTLGRRWAVTLVLANQDGQAPLDAIGAALRRLHLKAGQPSVRALARQIGTLSHTTVGTVLKCHQLPTWGTLGPVVKALDGDEGLFKELWMRAADMQANVPQVSHLSHRINTLADLAAELDDHRRRLEALEGSGGQAGGSSS